MKRTVLPLVVLLAAALCGSGTPAAEEDPDGAGQLKRIQRMRNEMALLRGDAISDEKETPEDERPEEEGPDSTDRAQLESFLRRLQGRFRIGGQIEHDQGVRKLTGKITGVADCRGVGEGPGVDCIINATWPVIDVDLPDFTGRRAPRVSKTEVLKNFNPAVLVLGIDPNFMRVRALLVTADSFTDGWLGSGPLEGNTVKARRSTTECFEPEPPNNKRCFMRIEITAEPESGIVTLLLPVASINITLTLRPDADAKAGKKMKSQRAR